MEMEDDETQAKACIIKEENSNSRHLSCFSARL